jgi:hypothetical protein
VVTALHNGYSSAVSSLDVSWQWILALEILQFFARWLTLRSWTLNPQVRCTPCVLLCTPRTLPDSVLFWLRSLIIPRHGPYGKPFSVVKNACLFAPYLAMDICEPHRKHILRRCCAYFSRCLAMDICEPHRKHILWRWCAYFSRCLEMDLHVTLRIYYLVLSDIRMKTLRKPTNTSLRLSIDLGETWTGFHHYNYGKLQAADCAR